MKLSNAPYVIQVPNGKRPGSPVGGNVAVISPNAAYLDRERREYDMATIQAEKIFGHAALNLTLNEVPLMKALLSSSAVDRRTVRPWNHERSDREDLR
ncbi:MAG: hypothetical protein ABSG26_03785 [Bryobacteraceae bacterium]